MEGHGRRSQSSWFFIHFVLRCHFFSKRISQNFNFIFKANMKIMAIEICVGLWFYFSNSDLVAFLCDRISLFACIYCMKFVNNISFHLDLDRPDYRLQWSKNHLCISHAMAPLILRGNVYKFLFWDHTKRPNRKFLINLICFNF